MKHLIYWLFLLVFLHQVNGTEADYEYEEITLERVKKKHNL